MASPASPSHFERWLGRGSRSSEGWAQHRLGQNELSAEERQPAPGHSSNGGNATVANLGGYSGAAMVVQAADTGWAVEIPGVGQHWTATNPCRN
eukprot:Skav208178  [mRNA]  locus=scaffold2530:105443:108896:+ [translate_table: standard]